MADLEQVANDLNSASLSLQELRERYDGALDLLTDKNTQIIDALNSEKSNALEEIQSAGDTATTQISSLKDRSLSAVNEAKNTATTEISSKKEEALGEFSQVNSDFNSAKEEALSQIEQAKAEQVEKITALEQAITNVQADLRLKQIQKIKNLISKKMLNDALNEKVGINGDETINGNKTFNGNNVFSGTNTFNQALSAPANPTNDNHLVKKWYVDYGGGIKDLGATDSINLDLSQAQHFMLSANEGTSIGIANFGGVGKSGTITINNCQNVVAFNAPFNFRITQINFSNTEIFAYFCIASNNVRLVRT